MTEETKGNSDLAAQGTEAGKLAQPGAQKAANPAAAEAGSSGAAAKPAPLAGAKPAAPVAKPAAPVKPAGPVPEPWNAPLPNELKRRFGSAVSEASVYIGQNYLVVDAAVAHDILRILRDEKQFDYCVDLTAVHYPKRERQFDVIWILYSFAKNERLRVKTEIRDGDSAPSVASLWPTANWLERECYDMFGVRFEGHPDLRRILLPDEWKGFPLRKDYGIYEQDQAWVRANLHIESGQ